MKHSCGSRIKTTCTGKIRLTTIYEIGQVDGRPFIAMEFTDGETLRQRMVSQMMKIDDVLSVAVQVASTLAAAHAAGIVPWDLKPENSMLRRDGYVKVVGFGLAKLAMPLADGPNAPARGFDKTATNPGVVPGTTRYMSTRQVRGLEGDAHTDLWSLGVGLYERLMGRAPFEGRTPSDVIAAILAREPPPVSHDAIEVPEALAWVVTQALTKTREERYQTAS